MALGRTKNVSSIKYSKLIMTYLEISNLFPPSFTDSISVTLTAINFNVQGTSIKAHYLSLSCDVVSFLSHVKHVTNKYEAYLSSPL